MLESGRTTSSGKVRTLGVLNLGHQISLSQHAKGLVHAPIPKAGDLRNQRARHDLVIFRTHLDLNSSQSLHIHQTNGMCARTEVRTLNSSDVRYRRSVTSSFI